MAGTDGGAAECVLQWFNLNLVSVAFCSKVEGCENLKTYFYEFKPLNVKY